MGENENLAYKQQCIWGFDQYSGEMNFHHRKTQLLKMCSNLMRHLLYWIIPQLEFIILGILLVVFWNVIKGLQLYKD